MKKNNVIRTVIFLLLATVWFSNMLIADDLYVGTGQTYTTIQAAVDASISGDVIHVTPGTYEEQVRIIGKNISLLGDTGAIILAPNVMAGTAVPGTSVTYFTPVFVQNADVIMRGLTVDGAARGAEDKNRFVGVVYEHAGGEISNCIVKDFREGVLSGRYRTYNGIMVLTLTDGPARHINIFNNRVSGFQKNGITVYGPIPPSAPNLKSRKDKHNKTSPVTIKRKNKKNAASDRIVAPAASILTTEIRGNTVVGQGVLDYIAQNGIQLSYADGIVAENNVSEIGFSGPDWVSTGILIYYSESALIQNNNLLNCEEGIYSIDSTGVIYDGNNLNLEPAFIAQVKSNPAKNTTTGGLEAYRTTILYDGNTVRNYDQGISLWNSTAASILDNRIESNGYGILLSSSTAPLLRDNCISNNGYGLYLSGITTAVDARLNYWGSTDGPSGANHPGTGDSIVFSTTDVALLNATTWTTGCEVGNLEVLITPAAPNTLGATWSIDGGTTNHNSGFILANLPAGVYTVTFSNVADWNTPAPMIVEVLEDSLVTVTGNYTQNGGDLRVIIEPAEARAAGAKWRLRGQATWRNSGTVAEGIRSGSVVVEFSNVNSWNRPGALAVSIIRNEIVTVTGTYNRIAPTSGGISIVFEDDPKWVDQARWRVRGGNGLWLKSGDIVTGLPFGEAGIDYKVIPGYILPDLGSGTVKAGVSVYKNVKYVRPLVIHKSDYNGDGTDDLAVFEKASGKWLVASISEPGPLPSRVYNVLEKKFGKAEDVPVTGDYNGDGSADLSYYRPKTGEWRVHKQFSIKNFGKENDIPVPGDYDGDGKTDAVLYRPETGEWIFYDLEKEKSTKVKFGSENEVPVPGNWNGDDKGQTDLAVYNVADGKWRVAVYKEKKQKWVRAPKYNLKYGAPGEIPIQADYDGDGKTDHAIFAADSNTWKIYEQFDLEFGIDGDVPVPNDWAGLGRVIPAVFRGKNGRWLAPDGLLTARHGSGGTPLMSGR